MKIAYILAPGRGDADLLLESAARDLIARGVNLCGTVQINTERPRSGPCDMDVQVLPNGPSLRISQHLGAGARGCRLDPNALETAVGHVEKILVNGADLLIVNKFGKHEAEGRGFRNAIAEALSRDIPVLVGLNDLNAPAFFAFTSGCAEAVDPNPQAVMAWVLSALAPLKAA